MKTPYRILGYSISKDNQLDSATPSTIDSKKKEGWEIDAIVYELPKGIDAYSKQVYKINNNQFYSSLINVKDLDGEIKYYSDRLSNKNDAVYNAVPSLRKTDEVYLKMLKFKRNNPLAIWGQVHHWEKMATGGIVGNHEIDWIITGSHKI